MQECAGCKKLEKKVALLESRSAEREANKLMPVAFCLLTVVQSQNAEMKALVQKLQGRILELEKNLAGCKCGKNGQESDKDRDDGDSSPPCKTGYLDKVKEKAREQSGRKMKKKKRGAKKGHKGHGRKKCEQIDNEVDLTLDVCPECGGSLKEHKKPEEHTKEDLVITRVATKYRVHRYQCRRCKAEVKPEYREGFIGDNAQAVSTLLHYYQGIPLNKIKELFGWFGLKISEGSLALWGKKFGEKLEPFWESLRNNLGKSPHLNVDETGWPVNGDNRWLWLFKSPLGVFFVINGSRGSKVVEDILGESYDGVLISDFYSAYNKLVSLKQKCLVHLLRAIEEWDKSEIFEKRAFHYAVSTLIDKAIKLADKKVKLSPEAYGKKVKDFYRDFDEFLELNLWDKDCARLMKRLRRHRNELWTFLEKDVPFHNNDAEREIRRSVINRKVSCGNRSDLGARVQEILLTAIHSAKLMGKNLLDVFLNPDKLPLCFDSS